MGRFEKIICYNETMAPLDWYPLLLEPRLSAKLWGGRRLAEHLHKPVEGTQRIGESWEAYGQSTVVNGALAGTRLQDLMRDWSRDLLGATGNGAQPFPLLFKFIDAQQDLSVQVHPDDAQARTLQNYPYGKTEAWYILHAEPGARIVHGFRSAVDEATVRAALARGSLEELLAFVPVARGDVVFVPAGMVHAIGAGIVLAEIQQQSDITYRFYDWNRTDESGKPRELHVEKALQVTTFSAPGRHTLRPLRLHADTHDRYVLVACRYFAWERVEVRAPTPALPLRGFALLSVIEGEAHIEHGAHAQHVQAQQGQTVLLPAAMEAYRLAPAQLPCTLLKAYVPDLQADVIAPLRAAGYDAAAIAQLGGSDAEHNDLSQLLSFTP